MTTPRNKLAVDEKEAAKLLSLPVGDFLGLVEAGALPKPVLIGKFKR